ncbi:magnesium/cobalt transporter CorA, partial [candidate division KSB1 bacterium]|nr:magnesium/cobalt transporter CorA [candidate division KSB1 bacterium]
VDECIQNLKSGSVTWINIDGLHQVELIEKIGNQLDVHPLILEDIVHLDQRPKMEDLDTYLFIVLRMISMEKESSDLDAEQVSIIVGPHYVISFQEHQGDVFDGIRDRIRNVRGRIRRMGADYLAYSLMDAIVDQYFTILEVVGEEIESMEDEVMISPTPSTIQHLHQIKRRLLFLRKSIWPLREIINVLERSESKLFQKRTLPYLRDLYDHSIQIIDMLETLRDMNSGMFDMYLSSVSNRMNEVMKVLTIIATIFIPLTFIAGVYGMNYEYIPELKWRFGYLGFWIVVVCVATMMILFFKRKKWL